MGDRPGKNIALETKNVRIRRRCCAGDKRRKSEPWAPNHSEESGKWPGVVIGIFRIYKRAADHLNRSRCGPGVSYRMGSMSMDGIVLKDSRPGMQLPTMY